MNDNILIDDIGDKITDGRTDEEKLILLSEKGSEKDIRRSIVLNANGEAEPITRYGSNKADD
jgi:hypothetical protein